MNKDDAMKELRQVNNNLTLLMKKKRALQTYIQEENDRLKGIATPKAGAWELKNDENFIKEHGRERTPKEIARLMNYSERQIRRFLQENTSN